MADDAERITPRQMRDPHTVREYLWEALENLKAGDESEAECIIEEMYDAVTELIS